MAPAVQGEECPHSTQLTLHSALLADPAALADLRVLRAGGLGAGSHPHGPARPRAGGHQQRGLHLRIQVIRRPHRYPRPRAAARQAGWI